MSSKILINRWSGIENGRYVVRETFRDPFTNQTSVEETFSDAPRSQPQSQSQSSSSDYAALARQQEQLNSLHNRHIAQQAYVNNQQRGLAVLGIQMRQEPMSQAGLNLAVQHFNQVQRGIPMFGIPVVHHTPFGSLVSGHNYPAYRFQ
jgi:hypothetical protein